MIFAEEKLDGEITGVFLMIFLGAEKLNRWHVAEIELISVDVNVEEFRHIPDIVVVGIVRKKNKEKKKRKKTTNLRR